MSQISISLVTAEDDRMAAILEITKALPDRAMHAIVRAVQRTGLEVVGMAVKERFTGQGPFAPSQNKLGVRSGRLRRSIRCTKPQVNLRTGEVTIGFGSNVVYFAIHEFGHKGSVQVKSHTRRLTNPGKPNRRGKLSKNYQARMKKLLAGRHFDGRTRKTKIGDRSYDVKVGKTFAEVRAHKRKLKVPARAPLGTQLKHITTRAAYLRNFRRELEPLLRGKKTR